MKTNESNASLPTLISGPSDSSEEDKTESFENSSQRKKGQQKGARIPELELQVTKVDVVLKTILRYLRKTYLNEFKQMTGYIKNKRYKDQ